MIPQIISFGVCHSVAGEYAQVEVGLTLLQVPHGLALDLDNNDKNSISLFLQSMCKEVQLKAFKLAKPHSSGCLRADVQHTLELIGLTGKEV